MKKIASSNLFWVLLVTVLAMFAHSKSQKQILAGGGDGWDGISYHALYDHFVGKQAAAPAEYPFCKRTGLPYLASRLNLDAAKSFLVINLVCGFMAIGFCYLVLVGRYSSLTVWACLMPMLFYLFSPVRFPHYYPFTVDPPAVLFYAVTAYFLSRAFFFPAILALVLSCLFKETGALLAILLPLALFAMKRVNAKALVLMILLALSGLLLMKLIQQGDCSGSQFRQASHNIALKLTHPMGVLKWVAGISLTLAPFLIPALQNRLPAFKDLETAAALSAVFLALAVVMGLAGGSDTSRIFFIIYPLYVLFLGALIDRAPTGAVVVAMAGGLIANRAFNRIPEPQNYHPDNDVSGFFSYFPDHGHIDGALSLILFWIVIQWLARHSGKLRSSGTH